MISRVSSADPASQLVNDQIAPDDGMWDGNPSHYFGVGQSALHCIKVSMLAAGIETFTNILDLPCGHGRVLRHLQHAFPRAQLTACDINMSATEFCARTFGAAPVKGYESPGKIALQGNYDLIWVGSLLTHFGFFGWRWLSPILIPLTPCAARFCAALEFIEVVNYFSYSSVDNYFYDK